MATVPCIGFAWAVPFGPALLISVVLGGVVAGAAPAAGLAGVAAVLDAAPAAAPLDELPITFGSLIADNP